MTISSMQAFQSAFAEAVRDPNAPLSSDLGVAEADTWRFSIYRNNFYHGMLETLKEAYPSVAAYLDDESFKTLALSYLQRSTITEVTLTLVAEDFADFLSRSNLADLAGLLSDLARLDRACLEALHAPDQSTLNPTKVQEFGERIADARFNFHAATRILSAQRPSLNSWRELKGNAIADVRGAAPQEQADQGALITRPSNKISVCPLTAAATQFGLALLRGAVVTQAFEEATAVDSAFDLTQTFAMYLEVGALHDVQLTD